MDSFLKGNPETIAGNMSWLNERSGKAKCRSVCMYAVFILRTGRGACDSARLLHQDHRLAAATGASRMSLLGRLAHKKKLNREFTHFHLWVVVFFLKRARL